MDAALPSALSLALEQLCEGRSLRQLSEKAQALSARYRQGAPSSAVIGDDEDALAYALTRMPATYAATLAALAALAERAPAFRPQSLADVGCGPGTASWAALTTFDSLERLALFDANRPLIDLAGRMLAHSAASAQVALHRGPLSGADPTAADLVIAAYVLTELSDKDAEAAVSALWAKTAGALVLVEPGTPRGWAGLMRLRSMLIPHHARLAAPCPHAAPCPVQSPDWCHFVQRLPRSRAHRLGKAADAPFEDEKFAYLAVVRPAVALAPALPRVLAPPHQDKAALSLKLCEPSGALSVRRIARRDKAGFRALRHVRWGDQIQD